MATLYFVGAGLDGDRSVGVAALDRLGSVGRVFVEEYTASLPDGSVERLAARLGSSLQRLDRVAVEGGSPILDELEAGRDVALLVGGDAFAATTHVALRLAVEAKGHAWRYLPGASVLTAAPGFLGLMPYRFGRPVSLPFPTAGFAPTSPHDRLGENRRAGAHTLVLLDVASPEHGPLLAGAAVDLLLGAPPAHRAIAPETELGVVARVGRDDARAWWAPARALAGADFGPPMHAVVVPAPELHFEESAAVAAFRATPIVRR